MALPAFAQKEEKPYAYDVLVQVKDLDGTCEVRRPSDKDFAAVVPNKAYPYGSVIKVNSGSCKIYFNHSDYVQAFAGTEAIFRDFGKRLSVGLQIIRGECHPNVSMNTPDKTFRVDVPTGTFYLTGRSSIRVKNFSDSVNISDDDLRFEVVAGTAFFQGLHYQIPKMDASHRVSIATAADNSSTRVTGLVGSYSILLPNGTDNPTVFNLSPECLVKLRRKRAEIGGNWVVSVLTVLPSGSARNNFTYVDSDAGITTGELISDDPQAAASGASSDIPADSTLDDIDLNATL